MSTLRINNIEAQAVPASPSIDEKIKLTNSSGDVLVHVDGKTSGITTIGINTTAGNIKFDQNSNVVVTGIITATKFVGTIEPTNLTVSGDLTIPDKIIHSGDTNTAIRFPAADTFTVETGGTEALRVDSSQRALIGHNSSLAIGGGDNSPLQVSATSSVVFGGARYVNTSSGPFISLAKSRAASAGSNTIVQSGDELGTILFAGDDGVDLISKAAQIQGQVDGTPGSNDMPGRLVFFTTADGAASPTERLRINSTGQMGLGVSPSRHLDIKDSTGANRIVNIRGTGTSGAFLAFLDANTTDDSKCRVGSIGGNSIGLRGDAHHFQNGAGTERLRIDSDGRLIQRYSAAPYDNRAATFQSPAGQAQTYIAVVNTETNGSSGILFGDHVGQNAGNYDAYINYSHQYQHMSFMVGSGTERVRITSGGQVNIGNALGNTSRMLAVETTHASGGEVAYIGNNDGSSNYGGLIISAGEIDRECRLESAWGNSFMTFYTNNGERVRINSSGQLAVNDTGSGWAENLQVTGDYNNQYAAAFKIKQSSGSLMRFATTVSGSFNLCGGITVNGNSTSFNTSSDYRLKENDIKISDGITRLKQLRPIRFNWKSDSSTTEDGFFAHEVSPVVPESVTGEKDVTIDEIGEGYQKIDHSKLVPLLTAALQEAILRIEALEGS